VSRAAGIGEVGSSLLVVPNLAGSAVGGIFAGRWADRSGFARPALVTLGAGAAGLLALGLLGLTPLVAVAANLVIGASASAGIALAASAVVELALRQAQGTGASLAAVRVGQNLGAALTPPLAGAALVHLGASWAYIATGLAMAASGLLLSAAAPSRRLRAIPSRIA
jgi:MFS family permease